MCRLLTTRNFLIKKFFKVIDYEIKLSEDELTAIIINGRVIFLSFKRAPGINASNHNPKIVAQPHFAIIAYTDDIMYCPITHLKDIYYYRIRPRQWIIPWNERNSSSRNGTLITIPKSHRSLVIPKSLHTSRFIRFPQSYLLLH